MRHTTHEHNPKKLMHFQCLLSPAAGELHAAPRAALLLVVKGGAAAGRLHAAARADAVQRTATLAVALLDLCGRAFQWVSGK